jgi:hypothetical protein
MTEEKWFELIYANLLALDLIGVLVLYLVIFVGVFK